MSGSTFIDETFLRQSIDRLRDKLIDISKRNPLISFKHGGRAMSFLRVVDEDPDVLFTKLRSGEMQFEALPDQDEEPQDERSANFKMALQQARLTDEAYLAGMETLGDGEREEERAAEIERHLRARVRDRLGLPKLVDAGKLDLAAFARAHGFDPSFDLASMTERIGAEHLSDNKIRVLHTRSQCEARLSRIADVCRKHAAESGIHTLHVAFGFVAWREAEPPRAVHHAPLLLLPARLARSAARNRYVYQLGAQDGELALNIALQEHLRRRFRVVVPEVAEGDTPGRYFRDIEACFERIPELSLRRFVTIGIFSFHRMALWQDLAAERWPENGLLRNRNVALLLRAGVAGGDFDSEDPSAPRDDLVEEDAPGADAPPLILPADVSQHRALAHAMRGNSLAIQGPPGTGKSQTIANLIAAAVDQGKRVLFCAEKRAALEVVAKRLVDRGFGPLMLDLHPETAKAAVMATLAVREAAAPPVVDRHLERRRRLQAAAQDKQRAYVRLLRRQVGADGRSLHDMLWRMMALQEELGAALPANFLRQHVDPERLGADDLEQARQALDAVERCAGEIEKVHGNLSASPWRGAHRLSPLRFEQEKALDALAAVVELTERLLSVCDEFAALADVQVPRTHGQATQWLQGVVSLPPINDIVSPQHLLAGLTEPDSLRRRYDATAAYSRTFHAAAAVHPAPLAADVGAMRDLVSRLRGAQLPETTAAELKARAEAADEFAAGVRRAEERLSPLLTAAFLDPTQTEVQRARSLLIALRSCEAAGAATVARLDPRLLRKNARKRLSMADAKAAELRAELGRLMERADIGVWEHHSLHALQACAENLARAWPFSHWFSRTFRSSLRLARLIAIEPSLDRRSLAALLRQLATWKTETAAFLADAALRDLLGEAWRGLTTDFEAAGNAAALLDRIAPLMASSGLGELLATIVSKPSLLAELLAFGVHRDGEIQTVLNRLEAGERLADATARAAAAAAALRALLRAAERAGVREDAVLRVADPPLDETFHRLHRLREDVALACDADDAVSGQVESADALEAALAAANAIHASAAPHEVVDALKRAIDSCFAARTLKDLAAKGLLLIDEHRSAWESFRVLVDASDEAFLGGPLEAADWKEVASRLRRAREDEGAMRLFAHFARSLAAADRAGVRFVFDAFVADDQPIRRLSDAYELLVAGQLLISLMAGEGGLLDQVDGASLAEACEKFCRLDEELEQLEADRVLASRLADSVPRGVGHGPVQNWTGYALIKRELNKQKRHLPIRTLVRRSAAALQTLKPVWLMSPLSVAQYVPPGSATFDLVVIDEASQMTPECAIGAIARGTQVVVVGDPKQLPPTDFFQARREDDDEAGEETADSQSVLDLAFANLWQVRQLRWHYRSRHHALIEFSNREFYDGNLIVFPAALTSNPLLGVKSVFVGGTYEKRINPAEAYAVIATAVRLMSIRPDLSIGVVTMNSDQRELMFREFERMQAHDTAVRGYVERYEKTIEPFFIKNLENVQGDERDVIIISTVYGPPRQGGRIAQRFGPINGVNGYRRLNVLFTRAKRSTMVFTSLKPADIVVDAASSAGLQAFRRYLEYAERGGTVEEAAGERIAGDFAGFLADRLEAKGYEIVPRVGVNGFRIDLGVRHPSYPKGFIAGIDFDGTEHLATLTVRDRERIRRKVLEGLGWRIYRIWSIDWFNDAVRETERLLNWLEEQRNAAMAMQEADDCSRLLAYVGNESGGNGSTAATSDEELAYRVEAQAGDNGTPEEGEPATGRGEPADDPAATNGEATDQAPVPVVPKGRRHCIDGIEFYEPSPGYYEVWIDGRVIGDVERLNSSLPPTHRNSRGQFRATVYATEQSYNYDDIYFAVREVARRVVETC